MKKKEAEAIVWGFVAEYLHNHPEIVNDSTHSATNKRKIGEAVDRIRSFIEKKTNLEGSGDDSASE